MWLRYWGKMVDDYSAMRWPCPSGFHVPMSSERTSIQTKMGELWIVNNRGAEWRDNFKMPYPWNRALWTGEHTDQWGHWYYWTCTKYSNERNRLFSIYPTGAGMWQWRWADWFSIRPFKDTPVIPDSNWTTLYAWTGDAGIFHNSTLWLISISSDWTTWITIADKNLWATTVYNNWNTLSQDNCGNFYQRWNNYWFPFTWSITISSTLVDAGDYWPWNYYSSSTFITISTSPYNWSSVKNTNLRWWDTWVQQRPAPIVKRYYGWKMVDDYSAMQWPCDTGFHVPLSNEFVSLVSHLSTLWIDTSNWIWVKTYLKFPLAWVRNSSGEVLYQWTQGLYWGSDTTSYVWNGFVFTDSGLIAQFNYYRVYAFPIRPFKDRPVIPDSSWTKLYSWTWDAGIYHNSTLWLISLSSDWTTRMTIADKNLWATTVYNSWDTLSEANCGKYFQWGNCSWLARTWSVTKIPWGLDVSDYWPWNYYSNSAFIYSNNSNHDWALPSNDNLRWWVTGIQQRPAEVIKVYKWNTLIREKS